MERNDLEMNVRLAEEKDIPRIHELLRESILMTSFEKFCKTAIVLFLLQ